MKRLIIVTGLSLLASTAHADGTCVARINQAVSITGPCEYDLVRDDGAFEVASPDYDAETGSGYKILISVLDLNSPVADAYWIEPSKNGKAPQFLGRLTLIGDCWTSENQVVEVCRS